MNTEKGLALATFGLEHRVSLQLIMLTLISEGFKPNRAETILRWAVLDFKRKLENEQANAPVELE